MPKVPTERQLAFLFSHGIPYKAGWDSEEVGRQIQLAMARSGKRKPNANQLMLAEAWGVKPRLRKTQAQVCSELFAAWEENPQLDVPDSMTGSAIRKTGLMSCLVRIVVLGCGLALAAWLLIRAV